jgi:uncharacterized repeat protein (TIGR03803 family)
MKTPTNRLSLVLALVFTVGIASPQSSDANAGSIKFTTLHTFTGADGAEPYAGLIQVTNGDLYGTTEYGGANATTEFPKGSGTIFKITPSGTLTTIYSFCAQAYCIDGAAPLAGLVQAIGGDLFGMTTTGGYVGGTLFKITPSGTLMTVLYSVCPPSQCAYFASGGPTGLIQAANGEFYGTTEGDGTHYGGTVFKMTPSGTITTLYNFCAAASCADGYDPYTNLIQATNGDLYGTTLAGGAGTACLNSSGCGTLFKITPSGTLTTLYSFCAQANCVDGQGPEAQLVQATDGYLYGTTVAGGAQGGGTVFRITPSGTLTTLYNFCSQTGCADGGHPYSALVQATDAALYGTTNIGGAGNTGTIFKITTSGALTTLYSFCSQPGCADGSYPVGLIQGTNGVFYGTTNTGGTDNLGTVFSLSTGQPPFVETHPTIGVVGEKVTILGYELTGATSVTFDGVPAIFTVDASTAITTTVPAGATTGKVQVITPRGTLSSNTNFEVVP